MMKEFVVLACMIVTGHGLLHAQDSARSRTLSMAEYEKARTLTVSDLDKDTYVKFENTYILDKSGFGKPYFITGDDGARKRIDLYKLILKEGRVNLGTVIYYTTENGKRYTACMPAYNADGKIWEKYFSDVHAIDREEPFFVLKLSYVLSKELGFQLYRAEAAGLGKDISKDRESGTYGNDICFPGDMNVKMADGSFRALKEIRPGDRVVAVDPATHAATAVTVRGLTVHEARNYAITSLVLISAIENAAASGLEIRLRSRILRATPNHPVVTSSGNRKMGEVAEGDRLICLDEGSGQYINYTVWQKTESAGCIQPVYNIIAGKGDPFIVNDVMVLQKEVKKP
jgi:hypothetical protein